MERTILNVKSALSKLTSMTPIKEDMDRVEINKSIMELNFKKEELQKQIDSMNASIQFLVKQRDMIDDADDDLFYKMFPPDESTGWN